MIVRITTILTICLFWVTTILAQKVQTFDYLRNRQGQVTTSHFLLREGQRTFLKGAGKLIIDASATETILIIRFEDLKLGLDVATQTEKYKRDKENFYLSIPSHPEFITQSGSGFKLQEVSNDGRLSDQQSINVNKSVEIKFILQNKTADTLFSKIVVKFEIDAFPGKTPIRASEKGGKVLSYQIVILPSKDAMRKKQADQLFLELSDTTQTQEELENALDKFLNDYADLDPSRTKIVDEKLASLKRGQTKGSYTEASLFAEIKKSFDADLNTKCFNLCTQYHQAVMQEDPTVTGLYHAEVLYLGALMASDERVKATWQDLLLKNYPKSNQAKLLRMNLNYGREHINKQGPEEDTLFENSTQSQTDSQALLLNFPITPVDQLDDYGSIDIDQHNQEIILRTANISKSYIIKFIDVLTKQLVTNPSFKGEEKRLLLDDLDIKSGDYEIFLTNEKGQQLAKNTVGYHRRKLSPEAKYLLGLSLLIGAYLIYVRYFKL